MAVTSALFIAIAIAVAGGSAAAVAAAVKSVKSSTAAPVQLGDLAFRSIGPANMGGRISGFAAVDNKPGTFYVATGTGGLFKTTNRGTTFSAVFDKEAVASIGAVAVWQKNPEIVWVGSGEANGRNSSSWGNGVYRSTDGGGSWRNVGLEATQTIARIVTDPVDSNTVYVAASGRLWGENRERGVFKTTDGGTTWQHVLKVDARTGACDLVMDPSDPQTLYAALYARLRTPWSFASGGTSGGIARSRDGGRTWVKLTDGLPARTGRIGLDVYRKNPKVVYAVIESDGGGQIDDFESKSREGGVFRSDDGGEHWSRVAPHTPRPFYFSQIRVQPDDDARVYLLGFDLYVSDDGGRTFRAGGGKNVHPDLHALWIDPADPDHVLLGTDGGVFQSHDRTKTWDFLNQLAIGEFYTVAASMSDPYFVCGGLQDNQTWCGPVRTRVAIESWLDDMSGKGILNEHWFCLGGGDGFYVAIDPTNAARVYYESQGADLHRLDLATGAERFLKPSAKEGEPRFRFNWNAPFVISPHDPSVLWLGGNHVFRLDDHGDHWILASPDLTTRNRDRMVTTGSAAETHCTIVTLAESPLERGLVWAGTDDGKLWNTRDGGTTWTDVSANLKGIPAGLYMSRIEPSHHDAGTAYLAVDGHRTDDYGTYLLVTHDYGRSWTSLANDLPPRTPVKVVREDVANRRLLFAGTEFGLYVSIDGGRHWQRLRAGLPTVAIDDLVIHPRERDLVVATHGRSLYVLDDITPLEQSSPATLDSAVVLFEPRPATAYQTRTVSGVWGSRMFTANNPPFGALLAYHVRQWTEDGVSLTIADSMGTTVRTLTGPGTPGFHRVAWDLQRESRQRIARPEWSGQPAFVAPGRYTVTLTYGKEPPQKRTLVVRHASGASDPDLIAPR